MEKWKIQSDEDSKTKEYSYSVNSIKTNLYMTGKQELQPKTTAKKINFWLYSWDIFLLLTNMREQNQL